MPATTRVTAPKSHGPEPTSHAEIPQRPISRLIMNVPSVTLYGRDRQGNDQGLRCAKPGGLRVSSLRRGPLGVAGRSITRSQRVVACIHCVGVAEHQSQRIPGRHRYPWPNSQLGGISGTGGGPRQKQLGVLAWSPVIRIIADLALTSDLPTNEHGPDGHETTSWMIFRCSG